jgi:hypothetical protein
MLRMKNNKGTGYDWIPAEVWKVILHYERWNWKFDKYV